MKTPLLVVAFMLAACSIQAQVKVKQGDKFKKVTTVDMQTSLEMMGQPVDMFNKSTSYEDVEIAEASANAIKIVHTTKRLVVNGSGMGQEFSYDTDDKTKTDKEALALQVKIGKSYSVTVDSRGKVIKSDFKDDGDASPAEAAKMKEGGTYDMVIPGGKTAADMKPGYSWTDTITQEGSSVVTTYKVAEVGKNIVIGYKSKATIKEKGGAADAEGGEVNLTGSITGKNSYDPATGLLTKATSNTNMTGTVNSGGQQMPMTVRGTTTLELQKQ